MGEAPWVMGMDEPEMPVADQAALVDRLACVPDASAGFMAALLVQLANAFNLAGKARVVTLLGVVTDSIGLKSGVRVMIKACPESQKPDLLMQLGKMVVKAEQKYGAAVAGAQVADFFAKVAPTLTALAQKPGTNWPEIGAAILSLEVPVSNLASLSVVRDEATLRVAVHRLVTMQPVPGPVVQAAVHRVLEEALVATKGKEYDWFLTVGAATPLAAGLTQPVAPQALAQGSLMGLPQGQGVPAAGLAVGGQGMTAQGMQPVSVTTGTHGVVKLNGLRNVSLATASAALSTELGVSVYITAEDKRRGYGMLYLPKAKWDTLFVATPMWTYTHTEGWVVTFESRKPGTTDLLVITNPMWSLTVPPAQRGDTQGKKKRVDWDDEEDDDTPDKKTQNRKKGGGTLYTVQRKGAAARGGQRGYSGQPARGRARR